MTNIVRQNTNYNRFLAQTVKRLSTKRETRVRALGREDPLEKEMAILLQYYCLENPMDRGAWYATVYGVAKSRTRLSDFTSHVLYSEFYLSHCLHLSLW